MMRSNVLITVAVASLAGCGGTGTSDTAPREIDQVLDVGTASSDPECSHYKSYTAGLAKATIDCVGTVGPFLFGRNEKGLLERRFTSCSTTPSAATEASMLLRIDRMLSLQLRQSRLPKATKCIAQAYEEAERTLVKQGNTTCPTWHWQRREALPTEVGVAEVPRVLGSPSSAKLSRQRTKEFHYYAVEFEKDVQAQPCGSAEGCAQACASVFQGFYAGRTEDSILGDSPTWLDPTVYDAFDQYSDPYNAHNGFWHQMSYANDGPPGDLYGDFARACYIGYISDNSLTWGACLPNDPSGLGEAETCTYWNGVDHVMGRLVPDILFADQPETWTSRCEVARPPGSYCVTNGDCDRGVCHPVSGDPQGYCDY
jgi:hypothetical protein